MISLTEESPGSRVSETALGLNLGSATYYQDVLLHLPGPQLSHLVKGDNCVYSQRVIVKTGWDYTHEVLTTCPVHSICSAAAALITVVRFHRSLGKVHWSDHLSTSNSGPPDFKQPVHNYVVPILDMWEKATRFLRPKTKLRILLRVTMASKRPTLLLASSKNWPSLVWKQGW